MRAFFLSLLISSVIAGSAFARNQYVQGYVRKDGTYVEGYNRSAPNNTVNDNYSTQGNVNPYTGQPGTKPQDPLQSGYTGFGKPLQQPNVND